MSRSNDSVAYRRKPRFWRWILGLSLVLGILAWSAPIIVSRTELKNQVVPLLLPELAGDIQFDSAQLNWLTPIQLNGLIVRDADGNQLLAATSVRSERSLLNLLLHLDDLGRISLQSPHAQLVVDQQHSNFDSLLASVGAFDDAPRPDDDETVTGFVLEIVDGRLDIHDRFADSRSSVSGLQMHLRIPHIRRDTVALTLSAIASPMEAGTTGGQVDVEFRWQPPGKVDARNLGAGSVKIVTQQFPAATMEPVFSYVGSNFRTRGNLTGTVESQWEPSGQGPQLNAQADVDVVDARLSAPELLGQEDLQSKRLKVTVDGTANSGHLHLTEMTLTSDFGNVQATGSLPLEELFVDDFAHSFGTWRSGHELKATGRFDLRQIAASLPRTLHLRQDTAIVGGELTFDLESRALNAASRGISGTLKSQNIVASTNGKTVAWQRPLESSFRIQSNQHGWIVDQFVCQSDFFRSASFGHAASWHPESQRRPRSAGCPVVAILRFGQSSIGREIGSHGDMVDQR